MDAHHDMHHSALKIMRQKGELPYFSNLQTTTHPDIAHPPAAISEFLLF